MTDRTITTIDFHGASLIVRAGATPAETLVAMKPVVEGVGLDWSAQHAKMKAHPVLGSTMAEITMVAEDGKLRTMTALPLNRLHFWLATIHANKVKPEIQERVITYQTEAADVLFEHFFGTRVAGPAPGTELVLSEEAKGAVGGIVKSVVGKQIETLCREIIPRFVNAALLEGGHVVSTEYKPALQVLIDRKVPAKGRRQFSQMVSRRLLRFSAATGKAARTSAETGRYLFHVDVIRNWLRSEGDFLIMAHMSSRAGQTVLPFPAGGRRKEKGDHEGDRA